jgi:hypothetical protein
MGDYSYLCGWDVEAGAMTKPGLEAKYYVPLFWMTMFDPGDLRDARVDGADFVKPPNATEKFEDTTYAYCEGASAMERLKKRMPLVGAATNETLAKKFVKFAQVYGKQPVLLRLTALADSPAFVEKVRAMLGEIGNPATSADRLRAIADLGHGWESRPNAENILVGWGTELTAPEREVAKKRKGSSKADRAERDRVDGWRTAMAGGEAADRKPYSASGTFVVGDRVDHAKFGPGVVVRAVDKTKIEVQFEQGMYVLVHKPA